MRYNRGKDISVLDEGFPILIKQLLHMVQKDYKYFTDSFQIQTHILRNSLTTTHTQKLKLYKRSGERRRMDN